MKHIGGGAGLLLLATAIGLAVFTHWTAALVVVVPAVLMSVFQVVGRRSALHRQETLANSGHATARGQLSDGAQQVLGRARWTTWLYDEVAVDVTTGPDGINFVPRPTAASLGGFRQRTVPWDGVVDVAAEEIGRQSQRGRISFTRLTSLRFRLTGDLVPWYLRPNWQDIAEEMAAEDGPLDDDGRENAKDWAQTLQALETLDDSEMGCLVVTFTTDCPGPLVAVVGRRASGSPLI